MEFIEASIFTKVSKGLLEDDDLRRLQTTLATYPTMGKIIPGTGGLRKLRWMLDGGGKQGGLRVIYYWVTQDDLIFLLYAYKKSVQDDITAAELKILRRALEE